MTRHYYAQKTMLSEHPSHAAVTAGVSLYARTSSRTWRSVLLAALCHTAQIRQQGVAIVYGQICQLTHEVDALREETALLFRTGHIQVPAILHQEQTAPQNLQSGFNDDYDDRNTYFICKHCAIDVCGGGHT